ncbi:MAG: D-alanyl-D-alanine carboxypeptidase [Elainellaceae cyanobacterium]
MFELIAAWLLATKSESPALLRATNLSAWVTQVPVRTLLEPQDRPDEVALLDLQNYLGELSYFGWDTENQGVWLQSGQTVLAQHQGKEPLPAASLTKIATTLVALATWGSEHQFVTTVSAAGNIENGVLQGDLIVQGGSNPLFVWEEAIALANQLQAIGVERIAGRLIITGPFSMNYEPEPLVAGRLLRQAFDGALWTREVEQQYALMPANTPRPSLAIEGEVVSVLEAQAESLRPRLLANHYSLSLAQLLKLMNLYSNNFMADLLADTLGGGVAISREAAALTGIPQREIQLVNGSGLGVENRLSARAAAVLLKAIQARLAVQELRLTDIFPVAGSDSGTLKGRRLPDGTPVKTGTLATVSALAGALTTRDRDTVWFAIINQGSNLVELRAQQDYLLEDLTQQWGTIAPETIESETTGKTAGRSPEAIFGDPARIEPAI